MLPPPFRFCVRVTTLLVQIFRYVGGRLRLSASLDAREGIYAKPVQDQSVKTEGVVDSAFYGLGLYAHHGPAPAL